MAPDFSSIVTALGPQFTAIIGAVLAVGVSVVAVRLVMRGIFEIRYAILMRWQSGKGKF